jgi:cytochrome c-type biogenesis protein CcmH
VVIFASVIAVGLFLAAAWAWGLLRQPVKLDVGPALRQLLIDKNEGRLSQEAVDQAQASLYSQVLSQDTVAKDPMAKRRALVLAGGGLVAVIVAVVGWMTTPPSGPVTVIGPQTSGIGERAATQGAGAPETQATAQAPKGGDLNNLVSGLAQKMEKDPGNGQGWLLLARTYSELRQYDNASQAYARATALIPAEAQVLADWADAHVMANERQWDEKARDIVKRAVKADAKNPKALTLAGSEAFDRKQYKAAIDFWKRAIAVEPPNSMNAKLAESNIQEALALLNGKKPASAADAPAPLAGTIGSPKLNSPDGQLKWAPGK